jgi:hypothetical protein
MTENLPSTFAPESNIMLWVMICIGGFIIGICASQIYNTYYPYTIQNTTYVSYCGTQAKIAGLWLPDIKYLSNYTGRYICVNIDETKTLTELTRVCEHEVGHEIFARECENNFTKCLEIEQ